MKFPIVWAKTLVNEDFSFIVGIGVIIIKIDTSQLVLFFYDILSVFPVK